MPSLLPELCRHPSVWRCDELFVLGWVAQQQQQQQDIRQAPCTISEKAGRLDVVAMFIAVSVGGAHECVVELSV
jgi:hypothetical protein